MKLRHFAFDAPVLIVLGIGFAGCIRSSQFLMGFSVALFAAVLNTKLLPHRDEKLDES